MDYRAYNQETDRNAVLRMWREVGWMSPGKDAQEEALDWMLASQHTLVADIHGQPECLTTTIPASVRYLEEDLPFCVVGAVITSPVARRQGLAGRLTAAGIAAEAAEGALVAGLGIFDQGFYDRLGFGAGGYEHHVLFDPAQLKVTRKARPPRRITTDHWQDVHANRLNRRRGHGSLSVENADVTRMEMAWNENTLGLGYFDGPGGALSHHLWCSAEKPNGPYFVHWMAYETTEQFHELMAILASLGEHVTLIRMPEPQGIQLQDLLERPFRQNKITHGSDNETTISASAHWQTRICNLPGCLERTHLPGADLRFNLDLTDPIENYLDGDSPWRGVAGKYVVNLGAASGAEPGEDTALPTLTTTVNAFTRMWMGVRPASGLAITDSLAGPPDLIKALDEAFRLPDPKPDWEM